MQNKMPEGYFLLPKGSFRLLLVLRLTRSIFQWTQFQLSKDFPKLQKQLFIYLFIFTFHNVCGCKWRRWCSRDYRLIHHKCVSIDGGLLSEKTAMGNSVFIIRDLQCQGSTRMQQSEGAVCSGSPGQRGPNEYSGRPMVLQWDLTCSSFLYEKVEFCFWLCILSPLVHFHLRHFPGFSSKLSVPQGSNLVLCSFRSCAEASK